MEFNTAWHESSGSTPALLFLGRELKRELPELEMQQPPQGTRVFWGQALANLNKARERVSRCCDALRSEAVFKVGDLVLIKHHPVSSKTLQRSAKIANKWSSPLVIAKCLAKVLLNWLTQTRV
jgi:hypothetical protein